MFVKILSLVTSGSALTVRNLKYDSATNKITRIGHGLANNDIVYYEIGTDGTATGGLTDKTAYMVSDKTDADFKLNTTKKVATQEVLSKNAVVAFTDAAGTKTNTLTKVTVRKVKATAAPSNCTVAAGTGVHTQPNAKAWIYCAGTDDKSAPATCNLGSTDATKHGKVVYNKTTIAETETTSAIATSSGGTALTTILTEAVLLNKTEAEKGNVWLLFQSGTVVKPVPNVANKWDTTTNTVHVQHRFADGDKVFYTATTVATGLVDHTVYQITGVDPNKESFKLKTEDGATAMTFTGEGKGGTFERAGQSYGMASAATTGVITLTVAPPQDASVVIFHCVKSAECTWGDLKNGEYYAVSDRTTGPNTVRLSAGRKVAAAAEKIKFTAAIADNVKRVANLIQVAVDTDKASTNKVTVIADAAGSGSAARSLAMFGSAIAMGAALLLA